MTAITAEWLAELRAEFGHLDREIDGAIRWAQHKALFDKVGVMKSQVNIEILLSAAEDDMKHNRRRVEVPA